MREKRPLIFGVAGGTASGKTTVAQTILKTISAEQIAYIPHDAYYKDLSHLPFAQRIQINFDHPNSLQTKLMVKHVKKLLAGKAVEIPIYDFKNHMRTEKTQLVEPAPIILLEGILIFTKRKLRDLMDVKIYVDAPDDVRFIRRLQRDMAERGRSVESTISQYLETVRPMHRKFVEPSKIYADVIIPRGGHNHVAMAMVVSRLKELLANREDV